ncbi:hypothetical protein HAX54_047352 [Datura stramonium]|uniref:Polymerase nucleotidyl transferase domain-containing protein n=1 Tax=Datura stramonium TaxID=4076 RepID=A0ABS8SSV1_DATST|nr:hypothetical protein [Datura stramonium]
MENTTNTLSYIYGRLNNTTVHRNLKLALKECAGCFQDGLSSFQVVYGGIELGDYSSGDYDLAIVDERVERCDYFLTNYKVKEPMVSIDSSQRDKLFIFILPSNLINHTFSNQAFDNLKPLNLLGTTG